MNGADQASSPMRRHPTKDDWTKLRPKAEQLYKVQKLKIRNVVEALEGEYGLRITERMFRQRAKQWNILKNRKDGEMKAALRKFREAAQAGDPPPHIELFDEQVTMTDLHEHFRKKLPPGQSIHDISTPTRSRAPTPLGLRQLDLYVSPSTEYNEHILMSQPWDIPGQALENTDSVPLVTPGSSVPLQTYQTSSASETYFFIDVARPLSSLVEPGPLTSPNIYLNEEASMSRAVAEVRYISEREDHWYYDRSRRTPVYYAIFSKIAYQFSIMEQCLSQLACSQSVKYMETAFDIAISIFDDDERFSNNINEVDFFEDSEFLRNFQEVHAAVVGKAISVFGNGNVPVVLLSNHLEPSRCWDGVTERQISKLSFGYQFYKILFFMVLVSEEITLDLLLQDNFPSEEEMTEIPKVDKKLWDQMLQLDWWD